MEIKSFVVGRLGTNCYLLTCPETDSSLIIDPGDDANMISEYILKNNFKPLAIVATHGHYDHILAAKELQLGFDIPFYLHHKDQFLVQELKQRAAHWMNRKIIEEPPEIDKKLVDNDAVSFGEQKLTVLHTPGHTPGGICLYNNTDKVFFSGDTIFADGVGRTDLSYSSPAALQKSLKKINSKMKNYHGFPGHGKDFIL
jgi:glyoxylase-like metal-dependent hydrolase (beta-lactamase superfamily II)